MPYKDPLVQKAYHSRYRELNRTKRLSQMATWREANREKARASTKAWRIENVERADITSRELRTLKLRLKDEMKSRPCLDCGQSFPPECMDYDHVRGQKAGSIALMAAHRSVALSTMLEEIWKCEVVCSNCHRTRTKTRRVA
jgi:hypothetical protein